MTACPAMPEAEAACLPACHECAQVIVEYASGGSTELAARMRGKLVISVESDYDWARNLRQKTTDAQPVSQVITQHVDIGMTGANQPERLSKLAQPDLGAPGYLTARQTRSKSGMLDKTQTALKVAQAEIEKLQEARERLARADTTSNEALEKSQTELQAALSESEQQRHALVMKTESMDADKTTLGTRLAEVETKAKALTVQNATIQAELKQSQGKCLALWKAHETLKLQHDVLLRQYEERAAPAAPGDADDR